jgi:histidinol phosphatase-like PHP family hydrolase
VTPTSPAEYVDHPDINRQIHDLLHDLASVQSVRQKSLAYARAAAAIFALEKPLSELRAAHGAIPKIPSVGPSSERVAIEVLDQGRSATVERAVAASGKTAEVEAKRLLRRHFLSRAEVLRVLADTQLSGIALADYRGDFQMHSTWSDGAVSIAELARACARRGYRYSAVTDHSHGLAIARGMSMDAARRQHDEISKLNDAGEFRVLKGVEANIQPDGQLDLSDDEIRAFEMVLAAPHSQLRVTEDQTPRILRALAIGGVHILAHPRGRQASTRAGIKADWDAIFAAAATRRIAIEIDGDPARQDLDYTLARRALDAGCLFALDSDAHNPSELVYAETSIAHARLAGIPASRVVNTWNLDRLNEWLSRLKTR